MPTTKAGVEYTHCVSCTHPMTSGGRKNKAAKDALRAANPELVFHTAHGLCGGCASRHRRAAGELKVSLEVPGRPDWMRAGLGSCASVDPDLWYPDEGGPSNNAAKRICEECPFQAECLEWALAAGERFGIWAGTSPEQRGQILLERAQAVA